MSDAAAPAAPLPLGDRPSDTSSAARRKVVIELTLLWLVTNLLIRAVIAAQTGLGLPDWTLAAVPCLFIYAPVALCRWRGVDSYDYRLYVPAFRDVGAWGQALGQAAALMGVILVPWLIGYHLYQTQLFGHSPQWDRLPDELFTLVLYQVFFVAIPEEFFYRGYMQTRLNEVFHRPYLLGGAAFGAALWVTALYFAFGHSLVVLRWWHPAIFFPGLLFGLLRERTGGVLAPAFFHAACNLLVVILDTQYGLIAP